MPLYEYKCQKCGAVTEFIQKVNAHPPGSCPECGGTLEKLMSAPAIQFKGSGWYITDYARKSAKASESAEKTQSTTVEDKPPKAKDKAQEKKSPD